MAYEGGMGYQLHMPSYFWRTFTEYPQTKQAAASLGIRPPEIYSDITVCHALKFCANKSISLASLVFSCLSLVNEAIRP